MRGGENLCGVGETRAGRSGEGRVKQGRKKLSSLMSYDRLKYRFIFCWGRYWALEATLGSVVRSTLALDC